MVASGRTLTVKEPHALLYELRRLSCVWQSKVKAPRYVAPFGNAEGTRCLPPPAARLSVVYHQRFWRYWPRANKRLEEGDSRDESADAQRHRVFLFIALCAVCIALGSTFAHVADYFNPAFIENHRQAGRTSVDHHATFDNDKKPAARHLLRHININKNEIGARNVDFNSRRSVTVNRHYRAVYGSEELKITARQKPTFFPTTEVKRLRHDLSALSPSQPAVLIFSDRHYPVSIPQLYIANNARLRAAGKSGEGLPR